MSLPNTPLEAAMDEVLAMVKAQAERWPNQNDANTGPDWALVLARIQGKLADCCLPAGSGQYSWRDELIKLAAVAISAWVAHEEKSRWFEAEQGKRYPDVP